MLPDFDLHRRPGSTRIGVAGRARKKIDLIAKRRSPMSPERPGTNGGIPNTGLIGIDLRFRRQLDSTAAGLTVGALNRAVSSAVERHVYTV